MESFAWGERSKREREVERGGKAMTQWPVAVDLTDTLNSLGITYISPFNIYHSVFEYCFIFN